MNANVNASATGRAALLLAATICALCQAQTVTAAAEDARLIRVTTRFIEAPAAETGMKHPALKKALEGTPVTLSATEMQELIGALSQKKGVHLMSAPSVTTRGGKKATVEVVREFIYPTEFEKKDGHFSPTEFEMLPIGVIVEMRPSMQAGGLIRIEPAIGKVNEWLGFVIGGDENLVSAGNGKWKIDDTRKFVGRENLLPRGNEPGGFVSAASIPDKMKSLRDQAKKGEVSKPVFNTRKWSGDAMLKQGEWMVSCLKRETGADAEDAQRIWFFIMAEEVEADENPPGATMKVNGGVSLLKKAEKIILPQVEFENTSLDEALDFLRAKSREHDQDKEGVNFVVRDGGEPNRAEITLSLRDAPLIQAVQYVTELSGMQAVFEPFAILIRPISSCGEGAEQLTRTYQVPAAMIAPEMDVKNWLALQGVGFQTGASASYNRDELKLVVKNIPQELRKAEAILEKLGVQTKPPEPPVPAIVARAQGIILPQIEFNRVSIEDAVRFLRMKSQQLDPDRKGVNLVLKRSDDQPTPKVTLNLRNVPLWEVLRYVSDLAWMKVEAGAEAIVIKPLGAGAEVAR